MRRMYGRVSVMGEEGTLRDSDEAMSQSARVIRLSTVSFLFHRLEAENNTNRSHDDYTLLSNERPL